MKRFMIYRPSDGKLGLLLYKTEKEARDRGIVPPPRETDWVVVEVRTKVKGETASPDEVEIVTRLS